MSQIERTINLPYTREQLFGLVNEVQSYPEFVPYCLDAKIFSQNGPVLEGMVRVGYKALGYTFSTRNTVTFPESIRMQLLSGPFQRLEGEWSFVPQGEGCQVRLCLTIIFKNPMLDLMFKHKISELTDEMVQAFVDRAGELYA